MTVNEASKYAGSDPSMVRGFWRRIRHNYFTPEQESKILEGISVGANKNQIVKYSGITHVDLEYFIKLKGIKLMDYNPRNPFNTFRYDLLNKAS